MYSDAPESLELTGKIEMLLWALTFLTSTWYIKNPFLKSKIVEVSSLINFVSCQFSETRRLGSMLGLDEIRRTTQCFGVDYELSSYGFEASHARIDAFLHW